MTNHDLNHLRAEFCKECHDRMLRARDVVEKCTTEIQFNHCCDLLHQEFDSLSGAARAVKIYIGFVVSVGLLQSWELAS